MQEILIKKHITYWSSFDTGFLLSFILRCYFTFSLHPRLWSQVLKTERGTEETQAWKTLNRTNRGNVSNLLCLLLTRREALPEGKGKGYQNQACAWKLVVFGRSSIFWHMQYFITGKVNWRVRFFRKWKLYIDVSCTEWIVSPNCSDTVAFYYR